MKTRIFTQGDRLISLAAILKNADGTVVDLSDASVKFTMENVLTRANKVDAKAAVVVDAEAGSVRYDWAAVDIDTPGTYYGWFIRQVGGLDAHYPVGDQLRIVILAKP
ncbi:MAG: BppU family phage baseplate upper protein [Anaerolineales bacterium]|nr:BppU family phage baseplate upper protein [Anaerolineales bacterium]